MAKKKTNRVVPIGRGKLSLAVLRVELKTEDYDEDLDIEAIQQLWIDATNQELRKRGRSVADIVNIIHEAPLTLNTRVYIWIKNRRTA